MDAIPISLVNLSRAQFALTAMYHWLFVPLTLGLGLIIAIMETLYFKTGNLEWKRTTQFWMKLFGVNFAIGIATGLILEFEFGTNWSNYSWFVGDIFGAPLAIEGILAFFLESTFIGIMFFGWNKVSKGFHLASTWLTITGATLSALWILVANAWMQFPDGMVFNPDTMRNEMADFWAVVLSPVAINKFLHTVFSCWIVGGAFCLGVSAWFLLKNTEKDLSLKSIRIAAIVGFSGALLTALTGDGSAQQVAQRQPMKLAAMEGLYEGKSQAGLVAFGVLNPAKKTYTDSVKPFLAKIEIPGLLSLLSFRDVNAFVPGISNIMEGGYTPHNTNVSALSTEARMIKGKEAISALSAYRKAKMEKNDSQATLSKEKLEKDFPHFGYGFLPSKETAIPPIPLVFYAFHLMVILGLFFLGIFMLTGWLSWKNSLHKQRWLLWLSLLGIPLVWFCSECGWVVAEVGRQPWVIQDIMPTYAAVSELNPKSVMVTFCLFALLFTGLLAAEVSILVKQIRKGPQDIH